MGFNLFLNAN